MYGMPALYTRSVPSEWKAGLESPAGCSTLVVYCGVLLPHFLRPPAPVPPHFCGTEEHMIYIRGNIAETSHMQMWWTVRNSWSSCLSSLPSDNWAPATLPFHLCQQNVGTSYAWNEKVIFGLALVIYTNYC